MTPEEAIEQRKRDYLTTFSSPHGKRVLDDFYLAFQSKSSHVPGDPYATAYNEGARAVYLRIISIIHEAKNINRRPPTAETAEKEE